MVVAASNEHEVNARVIQDANTFGILSMSVEQDQHASMHALVYHDEGDFQLAVSTKQQVPALNRVVLDDIVQYVDEHYTKRLSLLKGLRKHVLDNSEIENKHAILRFLARADITILQFLSDAIQKRNCMLLCFHGVKPEESRKEITSFIGRIKQSMSTHAISYAFISESIAQSVNQDENKVLPISYIMQILPCLHVQTILYPMLFQEGRFYDALLTYAGNYTKVCKPPFQSCDDIRELIQLCLKVHEKQDHMICIYHSSKTGKFASLLQAIQAEFVNVVCVHEAYKDMVNIPFHDEVITIFPLYMLKGMHMSNETDGTSSLLKRLKEQNCEVQCNADSCLKQEDLQNLFMKKIVQELVIGN